MLDKNIFKHGISLLFVGLSMCGGAMAQSGEETSTYFEGNSWNTVHGRSDYYAGSASQICEAAAQDLNSIFEAENYTQITEATYKGYEVMDDIKWIVCNIDLNREMIHRTNPNASYTQFYKDYNRTFVYSSKEEFPLNASICDGVRIPGEWGGVACTNDTDFTPCFWPEGLKEGDDEKDHVTDPVARQIMSICIIEHERAHIGNVGQVCWENRHGIRGNRNTAIAEINSFNIELACYVREKQRCEGKRDCIAQVDYRMDRVQVMIDYYNAQLGP